MDGGANRGATWRLSREDETVLAIESWIARVRLAAVVFAVLEVDSAPDRGSVFRLVLPLTPD